MRPCWALYQLLLFFVLEGKANEDYFGNFGYIGYKSDTEETNFHIEFNPSSVLAFMPARSCHVQFSGDHGTFSPPVSFGNIDVNLWCNWTVLAAPGKHIVIYITGFKSNKTCSENQDEIIFSGVSSSVENAIVYACWNKQTHVFATEASAVSVVLLWRSFSYMGSKKYFSGRYYVFDDPVLGPHTASGNCSLTSKQNISTGDVDRPPIPAERPTDKSHLKSVFPTFTSSKSFKSSIPVHHPQEPPTVMEKDHSPTTTAHEDTLRATRTLAPSLSTIYNTSKSQMPALTQSLEFGEYEDHAVLPSAEDLEPSYIGKWEVMSQSFWTWEIPHSEFLSETPSLISAHYTKLLEAAHLDLTSKMEEMQKFGKDQSAIALAQIFITPPAKPIYVKTTKVTELQRSQLSTVRTSPYFSLDSPTRLYEPPRDPHFITAHATAPPEPPLIHILNTDSTTPLLLGDMSYSSLLDQTIEKVNLPHFSVAHAFEPSKPLNVSVANAIEPPGTIPYRLTTYIEPTLSNVSKVHQIDFTKSKPLKATDLGEPSEVPKLTVTNNGDLPEMKNLSVVPAVGQSEFLNTAQLQILFTKVPLTNVEEQVTGRPWQVASRYPTLYPDSLDKSHVQLTDDNEQPFLPNSVLDLQMAISINWADVEQPLDPSSPQNTIIIPDHQLMHKITMASPPTPEIPKELVYSKSMPQIAEKIDMTVTVDEYMSSKRFETPNLPTIDFKVTTSLVEPTKELDQWTIKDNLEAISGISKPPISTPGSHLSFPGEFVNGDTFSNAAEYLEAQSSAAHPFHLQPTNKLMSNMDITTIELVSEGDEKSTYSYHTSSDVDLNQNAAGHPRGGYLDEEDETYFFGNQSDLELFHAPGDSLFVITTDIEHKDVVLRDSEKDLVESVRKKITERMIYFPSRENSLILKEIRWASVKRVTFTFWLQLIQGGKDMRNFLKTQLKALENYPFGTSRATLVSFTVEDVNECQLGIQNCHSNAHCVNMVGSYSCYCMDGYEDHSPDYPGAECISSEPEEHFQLLIGVIVAIVVTLLLVIIVLFIIQQKRRAKASISLLDPPPRQHGVYIGGDPYGQPLSSPSRHLSPRHGREHHTARAMSSTLELTKITVEQAAC